MLVECLLPPFFNMFSNDFICVWYRGIHLVCIQLEALPKCEIFHYFSVVLLQNVVCFLVYFGVAVTA